MKKLLGIIVLGLLLSGNVYANMNGSYLFSESFYTDCDIITKNDLTTFQNIVFVKKNIIIGSDRRNGNQQELFKTFAFNAKFFKGKDITIQVNSEFLTKNKAKEQALKYAKMVGQLPIFSRENIRTLTIHKGHFNWGAGNKNILIYTDWKDVASSSGKCEEEALLHESGHASLDWAWGGSVKSSEWKKAAKADNKFISKYASQYPRREDVAETINWWVAVRCKPDTISKSNYKKIIETIPNRLKYLDGLNYETYPLVCK